MTIRKCHIRLNKLERNRNILLECLYYINNQMHSKKQKEIEGLQDTEMEMETDKRIKKKKRSNKIYRKTDERTKKKN